MNTRGHKGGFAATAFRISGAGAIALHAAVYLAVHCDRVCSSGEMARSFSVSKAHLEKVLQRLTRAGIVDPVRGRQGGFRLRARPSSVNMRKVFEAAGGRLGGAECLFAKRACGGGECIMQGLIGRINSEVEKYFTRATLAGLSGKVGGAWRAKGNSLAAT